VVNDLRAIGVKNWYVLCQDRDGWSNVCTVVVEEIAQCRERNTCAANRASQEKTFLCNSGRHFRRQGDLTRHRCFCDVSSLSLAQDSS